jgi:hypothetical protein
MAIVPGQQFGIARAARCPARFRRHTSCYGHDNDVAEPRNVNKPGKSYPRPLADLLHKTLSDAFASKASPRPNS